MKTVQNKKLHDGLAFLGDSVNTMINWCVLAFHQMPVFKV